MIIVHVCVKLLDCLIKSVGVVEMWKLHPPCTQEHKWRELEEQRQAQKLQRQLQQEQAYLLSLQPNPTPGSSTQSTKPPGEVTSEQSLETREQMRSSQHLEKSSDPPGHAPSSGPIREVTPSQPTAVRLESFMCLDSPPLSPVCCVNMVMARCWCGVFVEQIEFINAASSTHNLILTPSSWVRSRSSRLMDSAGGGVWGGVPRRSRVRSPIHDVSLYCGCFHPSMKLPFYTTTTIFITLRERRPRLLGPWRLPPATATCQQLMNSLWMDCRH